MLFPDVASIIISAIPSALLGGYVGHALAQVRQRQAALINAKNSLDKVLVGEKQVIRSGKRDTGVDLYAAIADQEVAYRNLERCLSYISKRRVKKMWLVYRATIDRSLKPKDRLGFKPKAGDVGYDNLREVNSLIDTLLELVR